MDLKRFWQMIEKTRRASHGDPEQQAALLVAALARLPAAEIVAYQAILDDLEDAAYRADVWDMAVILGGKDGCSDDGFMDFRAWLIAQGQTVYAQALADPESLVDVVQVGQTTQAEELGYVAQTAYERSTGKDALTMPGRTKPPPKLKGRVAKSRAAALRRFPKAAAKFG